MNWITTIGLAAAICTTASFLPQVIKTVRTKQTTSLSLWMYIVQTTGIALWLAYGLLITDVPLILANIISLGLVGTILLCKLKYG